MMIPSGAQSDHYEDKTTRKVKENVIRKPSAICRTCLQPIHRPAYFNMFTHYQDLLTIHCMLNICVPEVYLGVSKNPVICTPCLNNLNAAYTFRKTCIETEKHIKNFMARFGENHVQIQLEDVLGHIEKTNPKNSSITSSHERSVQDVNEDMNPFQFRIENVVSLQENKNICVKETTDVTNKAHVTPKVNSKSKAEKFEMAAVKMNVEPDAWNKAVKKQKTINAWNKAVNKRKAINKNPPGVNSQIKQGVVLQAVPPPHSSGAPVTSTKPGIINLGPQKLSIIQTDNGQLLLGYIMPRTDQASCSKPINSATSQHATSLAAITTRPVILNSIVANVGSLSQPSISQSNTHAAQNIKPANNLTSHRQPNIQTAAENVQNKSQSQLKRLNDVPSCSTEYSAAANSSIVTVKTEPIDPDDENCSILSKALINHPRTTDNLSSSCEVPANRPGCKSDVPPPLVPLNGNNMYASNVEIKSEPDSLDELANTSVASGSSSLSVNKPISPTSSCASNSKLSAKSDAALGNSDASSATAATHSEDVDTRNSEKSDSDAVKTSLLKKQLLREEETRDKTGAKRKTPVRASVLKKQANNTLTNTEAIASMLSNHSAFQGEEIVSIVPVDSVELTMKKVPDGAEAESQASDGVWKENNQNLGNNPNNVNASVTEDKTTTLYSENDNGCLDELTTIKEPPRLPIKDCELSVNTEELHAEDSHNPSNDAYTTFYTDDELHNLLKDVPEMEREDVPEYISIRRLDHPIYPSHLLSTCPPGAIQPLNSLPSKEIPFKLNKKIKDKGTSTVDLAATKRKTKGLTKRPRQKRLRAESFVRDGYFMWDHDYPVSQPPLSRQSLVVPTPYRFHCYICDTFDTDRPLSELEHMDEHGRAIESEQGLGCRVCGCRINTAYGLNKHVMMHYVKCELCDKTMQMWRMSKHRKAHQRQPRDSGKLWKCRMCMARFVNEKTLCTHMK